MTELDRLLNNLTTVKTNKTVFTEDEIKEKINSDDFYHYLKEINNKDGFVKLFTIKINEDTKAIIKNTIEGRKLVTKKNNLSSSLTRKNQDLLDVMSVSSEVLFSSILREINNGRLHIDTPELNTLTPNKSKPDYIYNDILFDMKSGYMNDTININRDAHNRAVEQGLSFYLVGMVDSQNIDEISLIQYYYLPVEYFIKNSNFIDNTRQCIENHKNDFYQIKMSRVYKSKYIGD